MRNLLESVISVPGEIRKIERQQRENIKEKEKFKFIISRIGSFLHIFLVASGVISISGFIWPQNKDLDQNQLKVNLLISTIERASESCYTVCWSSSSTRPVSGEVQVCAVCAVVRLSNSVGDDDNVHDVWCAGDLWEHWYGSTGNWSGTTESAVRESQQAQWGATEVSLARGSARRPAQAVNDGRLVPGRERDRERERAERNCKQWAPAAARVTTTTSPGLETIMDRTFEVMSSSVQRLCRFVIASADNKPIPQICHWIIDQEQVRYMGINNVLQAVNHSNKAMHMQSFNIF